MGIHLRYTAIIPNDDSDDGQFNDGTPLIDDSDTDLDLVSERSGDKIVLTNPTENGNDYNRSPFTVEGILIDSTQHAWRSMNMTSTLESIKNRYYNPCRSDHNRSSMRDPVHSQH